MVIFHSYVSLPEGNSQNGRSWEFNRLTIKDLWKGAVRLRVAHAPIWGPMIPSGKLT